MMNFDLAVMTVLYWGRFLEEQRDADIPTQYWAIPEKKKKKSRGVEGIHF